MTRLLWEELTADQQAEFIKQMNHAGWKDRSKDNTHVYQIKNGLCYGWVDNGRSRELKSRVK